MKAIQNTLFISFLLVTIKISSAQPGALDPTFGDGGEVNLHPYFSVERAKDIAVTTDGKILLLSSSFDEGNHMLRLSANGIPDSTFGIQGNSAILFDESVIASAIEVDSMNRILVYAEDKYFYSEGMYVFRLLEDGSIDTTFGDQGEKLTSIHHGNRAFILLPNGKIVVGGQHDYYYSSANIQRLNSDGSEDNSFNGNGSITITPFDVSYVFAINQQADGKLLATGIGDSSWFAVRFNSNGELDSSFDDDGVVQFLSGDAMAGQGIVEMADGKILVVGHRETAEESSMLCSQLLPNGAPDASFGNNGVVTLYSESENNFAWFVFANADSTAIVGGTAFENGNYLPVIYHLHHDGSIDSSFGLNGVGGKTFSCGESIQLNGTRTDGNKILLSGTGFDNGNNYISVSQLFSDGNIDSSFALNGSAFLTTIDSPYTYEVPSDYIVLNDGKILFTGYVGNINHDLIFFRLTTEGQLDSTYGVNGYYLPNQRLDAGGAIIATDTNAIYVLENAHDDPLGDEDLTTPPSYSNAVIHKLHIDGTPEISFGVESMLYLNFPNFDLFDCTDLALQSDGKLLLAGSELGNLSNSSYVFLERLNGDGSIDSTFADNGIKLFDSQYKEYSLLIAVRDDDKIDCAFGYYLNNQFHLSVSRLLQNGSFDSTFASNGGEEILIDFTGPLQLIRQSDNKMLILLGGYQSYTAVLRISEDGSIDSAFSNNGFLSPFGYASGMQLQPDKEILTSYNIFSYGAVVARFKEDGDSDLTFGTNGVALVSATVNGASPNSLRLQTDGKILFAYANGYDFFVARLLNDIGLSANESTASSTLYVYPNPVSDQLMISNHFSSNEQTTISISNNMGEKVWTEAGKFSGDYFTLPVPDLPPGIYLITVQTENNLVTTKFVKQ